MVPNYVREASARNGMNSSQQLMNEYMNSTQDRPKLCISWMDVGTHWPTREPPQMLREKIAYAISPSFRAFRRVLCRDLSVIVASTAGCARAWRGK
jgi:hypothetical protein